MIGYVSKHLIQLTLLAIVFISLIMVFARLDSFFLRLLLITFLSGLYFAFGLLHHLHEKTLSLTTLGEYLILSLMLLWTMLALLLS